MVPYSVFTNAFLSKITDYDFVEMGVSATTQTATEYMHRAIAAFRPYCKYDLATTGDDNVLEFDVSVESGDLYELVDIISEGMVVHWLKPYIMQQDVLKASGFINTKDFSAYSPANLLAQIQSVYRSAEKRFVQMMREYSYRHGDLTELHL